MFIYCFILLILIQFHKILIGCCICHSLRDLVTTVKVTYRTTKTNNCQHLYSRHESLYMPVCNCFPRSWNSVAIPVTSTHASCAVYGEGRD